MGKGGSIRPGPPGHRSLVFEVIQKTITAGSGVDIKADDLELINEIKHVYPIIELSHTSTTSLLKAAYAPGVRVAGDSSATVYYYKLTTNLDISCIVLGY